MTKILICTDFDGTITGRAGQHTVFSEFFQSLTMNSPGNSYRNAMFRSPEEVQNIFEKKFGPYNSNFDYGQQDSDLLMSRDAVNFFKAALNDDRITVKIITKNLEGYIRALFRYHGFTDEECSRLQIDDSGLKRRAVDQYLSGIKNPEERPSQIYILDDNSCDFDEMVAAAELPEHCYTTAQIKKYHKKPGEFSWELYLQDIRLLCPEQKKTPVSKETLDPQPPFEKNPKRLNNDRPITIASSAIIGLFVGILIACILIVSKVFLPAVLGGVLGLLGITLAIGLVGVIVGGAIGYGVSKYTESKITSKSAQHQKDESLDLKDSADSLKKLNNLPPDPESKSILDAKPGSPEIDSKRTQKKSLDETNDANSDSDDFRPL